jgi:hypothetical protein
VATRRNASQDIRQRFLGWLREEKQPPTVWVSQADLASALGLTACVNSATALKEWPPTSVSSVSLRICCGSRHEHELGAGSGLPPVKLMKRDANTPCRALCGGCVGSLEDELRLDEIEGWIL